MLNFNQKKTELEKGLADETLVSDTASQKLSSANEDNQFYGLLDLNPCSSYLSNLRDKMAKSSSRQLLSVSKNSSEKMVEDHSEKLTPGQSLKGNQNRYQNLRNHFTKIENQIKDNSG